MFKKVISFNDNNINKAPLLSLIGPNSYTIDISYLIKRSLSNILENKLVTAKEIDVLKTSASIALIEEIESILNSLGYEYESDSAIISIGIKGTTFHYIKDDENVSISIEEMPNDRLRIRSNFDNSLDQNLFSDEMTDFLLNLMGAKNLKLSDDLSFYNLRENLKLLKTVGDQRLITTINRFAFHPKARIRREAVPAIANLQTPGMFNVFKHLLNDDDYDVRWKAAIELSRYQTDDIKQITFDLITNEKAFSRLSIKDRWAFVSVLTLHHQYKELGDLVASKAKKKTNPEILTMMLNILYRHQQMYMVKRFIQHPSIAVRETAIGLMLKYDALPNTDISPKLRKQLRNTLLGINPEKMSTQLSEVSRHRIEGTLMGIGLGDALGAPFEFMSKEQILQQTETIDRFYINTTRPMAFADITDDTETTLLTMNSITANGGFSRHHLSIGLANKIQSIDYGYEANTGYGHNTIRAGRYLYAGVNWRLIKANNITCGGAMRIAPFSMLYRYDNPALEKTITDAVKITHDSPLAISGAVAVGKLQSYLMRSKTSKVSPDIVLDIAESIRHIDDSMAEKLIEAYQLLQRDDITDVDKILGTKNYALSVVPYSFYSFFKNMGDFTQLMTDTIIIDGDSDSIAAIAASFYGALNGIGGFNLKLLNTFASSDEMQLSLSRFLETIRENEKSNLRFPEN